MATPSRHLLVDGHNVLHAWEWMSAGEPAARARLIEALRAVHDAEAVEVTVVFDSRGELATVDAAQAGDGFVVRYASAGLTADGVIERLAAGDPAPQRCVVATGDALILGNVRAAGGEGLSPEALREWIERCQARSSRRLRVRQSAQREKFGNKLPL